MMNKIPSDHIIYFNFLYITVGVMAEISSKHLGVVVGLETAAVSEQVSSSCRRGNGAGPN